jgi:hypothetical protein
MAGGECTAEDSGRVAGEVVLGAIVMDRLGGRADLSHAQLSAKFLPMTIDGRAMIRRLTIIRGTVIVFPRVVLGWISPKPTVVIISATNQNDAGILENWLGSPFTSIKVRLAASQLPLSAKYKRVEKATMMNDKNTTRAIKASVLF